MGQTILLIDDSAILRRIATNVLGASPGHFEVVTATRASEGFARACGTKLDLILVDSYLAGTTKAELCQRLLAETRTAAVPVVLLLRRGAEVPGMDQLPDNVVDTLSKPFTPEQLMASVSAVLQARRENLGFASIRSKLRHGGAPVDPGLPARTVAAAATPKTKKILRDRLEAICPPASSHPEHSSGGEPNPLLNKPANASLRSMFQNVASERGSAVLNISEVDRPLLSVYFDAGSVVAVATREATAYSRGSAELLPSKVSPATLEGALEEQIVTGVPFILTLGARGLLSKAGAVSLLHRFGQCFFSKVWTVNPARLRCDIERLDALPGFALRLEPRRESADEWLLGALRYLEPDDIAFAAKHDGFVGTPSLARQGQSVLRSLRLTPQEEEFVRRVNGRTDLPAIAKSMGLGGEAAYLLMHRFRALEVLDYRPAPAAFVVTPRTNVRRVLPLQR